jgi:hypothetical protein
LDNLQTTRRPAAGRDSEAGASVPRLSAVASTDNDDGSFLVFVNWPLHCCLASCFSSLSRSHHLLSSSHIYHINSCWLDKCLLNSRSLLNAHRHHPAYTLLYPAASEESLSAKCAPRCDTTRVRVAYRVCCTYSPRVSGLCAV